METQVKNLGWRIRAKVVAVTDIVSVFIHLFLTIFVATMFNMLFPPDNATQENVAVEQWVFLTCIAIGSIYSGIEMFAGIKLLCATGQERDHQEALKNADLWKYTTILCFAVSIILYSLLHFFIPLAITIGWRIVSFCVVVNFIKEVEKAIASQDSDNPDSPLEVMINK